jgi:hypothetical protein
MRGLVAVDGLQAPPPKKSGCVSEGDPASSYPGWHREVRWQAGVRLEIGRGRRSLGAWHTLLLDL